MEDDKKKTIDFYKEKAIQSFLLCIEVYNKPTIDYRLEGCIFFLCNAWELMLKAKLLTDNKSIYYKEKNGITRTISLSDALSRVLTNEKDPVVVNMKVIISFRNLATHSIIPEMEILYTPFLSMCVKNFVSKMYDFFNIDINSYIKNDFLSLFNSNKKISEQEIMSKYGEGISNIFNEQYSELQKTIQNNGESSVAQIVTVNFVRISNKSKADYTFYVSNNSKDPNVKYIDRLVDYNKNYPLTYNNVITEVDALIKKNHIEFTPIRFPVPTSKNPSPKIFTSTCFDILLKTYGLKENNEYCVKIENGKNIVYKYSEKIITYLISLISENKNIVIENKKTK